MFISENVDQILPALLKVKENLQAVTKSAANPFFKSKYADLNTHLDAVEPLLAANGLILLQPVSTNEVGTNSVASVIMHTSGQFIRSEMRITAKEEDMQKFGSAITYARRYTLGALLSMKAEDDDGENAVGRNKTKNNTVVHAPVTQVIKAESGVTTAEVTAVAAAPARRSSFRKASPAVTASPASQDDI